MSSNLAGWVAADLFTVIGLSLLIFLKEPTVPQEVIENVESIVRHEVQELPLNSQLLRQNNGEYQTYSQRTNSWTSLNQRELKSFQDKLIIGCENTQTCAALWGIHEPEKNLMIVLPESNKKLVQSKFFDNCQNKKTCDQGVLFTHKGSAVDFKIEK
jgi:hypothetical protein